MLLDELSVVEINPTELCNLKCSFCPRSTFYPNLNLNMDLDTAREVARQLKTFGYNKYVSITGRGEPTLHPQFEELCEIFMEEDRTWLLKINTNTKNFEKYYDTLMRFDKVHYNMYEHSVDEWQDQTLRFFDDPNVIVIRKEIDLQWHEMHERENFANRAGSFETNNLPVDGRCEKLFTKIFIDYDGTYRLCDEDWKDKISMGTIFETDIMEYMLNNEKLKSYRQLLITGDRCKSPCTNCAYKSKYDVDWKHLETFV